MKQTERNRNVFPGVGIGATSILIIFVLLCLVVFAMLSFVNANADRKLNRKLADRTQAYYEACEKAEALLEDIDLHLEQFYLENRGTYLSSCLSYLENHFQDASLRLCDLCRAGSFSESSLRRAFCRSFGLSPKQYLLEKRLRFAASLLAEKQISVKEAAFAAGFTDEKYFSRCMKKKYGAPPSAFGKTE